MSTGAIIAITLVCGFVAAVAIVLPAIIITHSVAKNKEEHMWVHPLDLMDKDKEDNK